jgi:hypothetical protein
MAADTALKRYSAMNLGSPWRGLNVVPDVAIPQGERQAVQWMYSGILAEAAEGAGLSVKDPIGWGVIPFAR